jgi:hypothetical protein
MALSYDFDMFSVFGSELFSDPKIGAMLQGMGMSEGMAGNKVPLFRSQATVDALRRAPEEIQNYMKDLGFGLNTFDSGAGPGFYPPEDDVLRLRLIGRSTEILPKYPNLGALKSQAKPGDFMLGEFLMAMTLAQPLDRSAAPAAQSFSSLRTPQGQPAARPATQPGVPARREVPPASSSMGQVGLNPVSPSDTGLAQKAAKVSLLAGIVLIIGALAAFFLRN